MTEAARPHDGDAVAPAALPALVHRGPALRRRRGDLRRPRLPPLRDRGRGADLVPVPGTDGRDPDNRAGGPEVLDAPARRRPRPDLHRAQPRDRREAHPTCARRSPRPRPGPSSRRCSTWRPQPNETGHGNKRTEADRTVPARTQPTPIDGWVGVSSLTVKQEGGPVVVRRAGDEELLAGALHARIERWLELESVLPSSGSATSSWPASWTGTRVPASVPAAAGRRPDMARRHHGDRTRGRAWGRQARGSCEPPRRPPSVDVSERPWAATRRESAAIARRRSVTAGRGHAGQRRTPPASWKVRMVFRQSLIEGTLPGARGRLAWRDDTDVFGIWKAIRAEVPQFVLARYVRLSAEALRGGRNGTTRRDGGRHWRVAQLGGSLGAICTSPSIAVEKIRPAAVMIRSRWRRTAAI